MLYACREEIEVKGKRRALSHGFRKEHSIITNARPHKGRRYVLNLDIENFFPSFNFGRVRGFFIKNRAFELHDKVATIIAQIACFENMLPQGSPCSPIIADLITHPLDVRLAQLAKRHRLTYTRYADDLTFSTNQKAFPAEIAAMSAAGGSDWRLGEHMVGRIRGEGFAINAAKTRMQVRTSQQLVTGLTLRVINDAQTDLGAAMIYEDGLTIAMDTAHPVRLKNLHATRIGVHLIRMSSGTYALRSAPVEQTSSRCLWRPS